MSAQWGQGQFSAKPSGLIARPDVVPSSGGKLVDPVRGAHASEFRSDLKRLRCVAVKKKEIAILAEKAFLVTAGLPGAKVLGDDAYMLKQTGQRVQTQVVRAVITKVSVEGIRQSIVAGQ